MAKKVCTSKYGYRYVTMPTNYELRNGQCLSGLIDVITADTRSEAGQVTSPYQDTHIIHTLKQSHRGTIKPLPTT